MKKAKVITFTHHKGGTGKTSSCLSIAGYLAKAENKVLVVDLDPQANATSGLGVDCSTVKKSMYHVLGKKTPIKKIILKTSTENIHLAPSSVDLTLCDKKTYKKKSEALQLDGVLKKIKSNYDYILLDTAPKHSHLIISAALAADDVVLVLDPGVFALEGVDVLHSALMKYKVANRKVNVSMALLTKCKSSFLPFVSTPTKEIKKELQEFDFPLFTIPYSNKIYYSQQQGVPISHYKPRSSVGVAYQKVAEALID